MEIGPIVRALLHHRSRLVLIALEIALTLAIVANCLNMIGDTRAKLSRPTGMDEGHLLVATCKPFAPEFDDEAYVRSVYDADLRALRALPGVRAATALHQVPLSGGGSATGRRAAGTKVDTLTVPYFDVGTDVLATLGLELVAGRDFVATDFPTGETPQGEDRSAQVILTQAMADVLYPEGDALGRQIESADGTEVDTIVGIVRRMHGSWPLSDVAERVALVPDQPFSSRRTRYFVRAQPDRVAELARAVEEKLLELQPGRVVAVETLAEIKRETYRDLIATNRLLGGVSVLLVAVTALGVVGLTSFSVTQRTRQIGTRRALGATRFGILRYFLVENWLITSTGLAAGVLLTYGLNYALAQVAETPRVGFALVGAGMLGLWIVGLLAALLPALRGTAVPPVVATRSV